jgi:hypothetical protein
MMNVWSAEKQSLEATDAAGRLAAQLKPLTSITRSPPPVTGPFLVVLTGESVPGLDKCSSAGASCEVLAVRREFFTPDCVW